MNWANILAVAVGGAIGSVARYLVGVGSGKLFGLDFPWGTLIINVVGSTLIGWLLTEVLAPAPRGRTLRACTIPGTRTFWT